MTDYVTLDPGSSGANMPVDIASASVNISWPYTKLAFGADGTQNIVGSISSNPLPVALSATDNGVLDSIQAAVEAIQTAAETLDNIVSGSEAQVDVVASLPAGTNAIGKLAANSGVDIGDVDVTSLDGVAAEGAALGNGILIQGDDGTDRKNINVHATTGDVQVDVTNTVTVDATGQGDVPVTLAGEAVVLGSGSAQIGKLAANSGVDIGDVDILTLPSDVAVAEGGSLGKGLLLQGDDGTDRKNVAVDPTTGNVKVDLGATDNAVLDNIDTNTKAAQNHYRNIDANAESEVKNTGGILHWVHVMNLTASKAYLHLYDASAGAVSAPGTTPDHTFPIPTQGDTNGAGFNLPLGPNGQEFANGITLACTTTIAGSAGDPGTNGVFVNAGYT